MRKLQHLLFTIVLSLVFIGCAKERKTIQNIETVKEDIHKLLNQWHIDVAQFEYVDYFDKMDDQAVFVGTDAAEVWSKMAFQEFSKPYFDKKQTWEFRPLQRNIYIDRTKERAWFDETLDTWMGVCRGSGVLVLKNDKWKIQHYVLSVTIPNEFAKEVTLLKKEKDSLFIQTIKK